MRRPAEAVGHSDDRRGTGRALTVRQWKTRPPPRVFGHSLSVPGTGCPGRHDPGKDLLSRMEGKSMKKRIMSWLGILAILTATATGCSPAKDTAVSQNVGTTEQSAKFTEHEP